MKAPIDRFDVVVVGGGPAGLCCALALALDGAKTGVVAPQSPTSSIAAPDRRTAALFAGSIAFLKNLGIWHDCEPESAPICAIRIVDDLGGLLRSPETCFSAREIGYDVLGYNVPQQTLGAALTKAIAAAPAMRAFSSSVVSATPASDGILLELSDGTSVASTLAIAADGRRSLVRSAAGIDVETWSYPQSALVCSFEHDRPHGGISTELHRPSGPCTTVPLPGSASSLVWVEVPERIEQLKSLNTIDFAQALEATLKGLLGSIDCVGPRAVFPLSGLRARPLALNRIALVGEAGHVIPPIGAQGLNLGLRDGATIAGLVADALRAGSDPGGPQVLESYDKQRSTDVASRITAVDLLNRSLLSTLLPVQLLRGAGIHALKSFAPLRKALVREGLDPSGATPRWMSSQPGPAVPATRAERDARSSTSHHA